MRTFKSTLMAIAVASILFMLLVQCIPQIMNRAAVIIGTVAIIALAIAFIVYPSKINSETRFLVFAITLILLLIIICTFIKNFKSWGLNGIFLKYATKFICARLYLLLLPILFLGLMAAFFFFQVLQYRSFWSNGELEFDP